MIIRIKNLRLRTIIGIFDWEREHKQDLILNMRLEFDGSKASSSDKIEDAVDYKKINKKIIDFVEKSDFFLLEKLAQSVVDLMLENPKVTRAQVEIDKPGALRFADSVSVECEAKR